MATVGLPPDETIHTTAGHAYAFDAMIKASHSKADLFALAAQHGFAIASYGEGPLQGNYRRVVVMGVATAASAIPWSVPWPVSIFDDSHIVAATEETAPDPAALAALALARAGAAIVPTSRVAPAPTGPGGGSPWVLPVVLVGLGVAADLLTGEGPASRLFAPKRRRARRRLRA